ncbi:helix-turn-helix domain-containing protein [Kitasatospora sp. NPDC059973]|uniref:helix-turn-helix domain-containing protein n=1 Tax=Kitasatospora sp. NPDC059973 TaxID=3347020 RepID=UPI0036BCB091
MRGNVLRELMKARKLTPKRVAEHCDCSASAVRTWRVQGTVPLPPRLRRLADLLGVAVADLLEPEGAPTLKQLRMSAGLRQSDAARALEIGVPAYCDVERGRQMMPPRWIPVLASAFNVSRKAIAEAAESCPQQVRRTLERGEES